MQQVESIVIQMQQRSSERVRKQSPAVSVTVIVVLINSPGIMKQSKQRDYFAVAACHFGNSQSVFEHAGPVNYSVIPGDRKRVFEKNLLHDRWQIMHNRQSHLSTP